jgi:tetratricopeptide (TPR) repeat protein
MRSMVRGLFVVAFAVCLASADVARGQGPAQHDGHTMAGGRLGMVRFETSCAASAQPTFTHALALLHSFEFRPAIDGFHEAVKTDPSCAIAYWGVALASWGNPFAAGIKPPGQIAQGLDAVQRARSTGSPTPRERGYIEAVAKLFEHADTIEQPSRLMAYRDAMEQLAAREHDDTEATIFYALALAATAPPTDKTYANQLKAGAILERLFAAAPDHPGLAHYIIHSYDVPPLAPRALEAARRYSEIAPSAPHALHMPSHTFTRVGAWQSSIDANLASAAAARQVNAVTEELHADDYLAYAYLQAGRDAAVRRLVEALPEIRSRFDPSQMGSAAPPTAGFFSLAAIPSRYALERGDWSAAMALPSFDSPARFADALREFARGLGAARAGHPDQASAAAVRLAGLHEELARNGESYWADQVDIERAEVEAWAAFARGKRDEALDAMRQAAAREDATEKNAVTPGPVAPARELLGEMLLELNRPAEALPEFETALKHEPNRFRSLAGAARAARFSGNDQTATARYATLLQLCAQADQPGRRELSDAREWLAGHPATP